ncbi:hypothetical protein [Nonomuraea fuscirosea]|uniref:hypothetical protein n=1 Tax=Nonomuraea fuscirosea TaxID=1291556 RepID=UPI00342022DE
MTATQRLRSRNVCLIQYSRVVDMKRQVVPQPAAKVIYPLSLIDQRSETRFERHVGPEARPRPPAKGGGISNDHRPSWMHGGDGVLTNRGKCSRRMLREPYWWVRPKKHIAHGSGEFERGAIDRG